MTKSIPHSRGKELGSTEERTTEELVGDYKNYLSLPQVIDHTHPPCRIHSAPAKSPKSHIPVHPLVKARILRVNLVPGVDEVPQIGSRKFSFWSLVALV